MNEAIIIEGVELKCDAPGCDHVEAIREISAEYLNKPCVKCGASLLTQQDLDAALELQKLANVFNDLCGPSPENAERVTVSINPHKGRVIIDAESPFATAYSSAPPHVQ